MTAAAVLMTIVGGVVTFLQYLDISPGHNGQSLQQTVYVHGQDGKQHIVLENTGKLVVDFDNDRRTAMIGEDGRTNFGEIPEKFSNQKIGIGLDAPGYELIDLHKQYKLHGKPIYLAVKRDNRLGMISGRITNREGSEFIKDALVMVGHDATTTTDELGIFKITLPVNMQVKDKNTPYKLIVKKEGYETIREDYYPGTPDFEIRLEK